MGTSNSKAQPREPPVSWRAAIWPRLQIWEELKPYLTRIIKALGRVAPKLPISEPREDPSSKNKQNEAVTVVETMLIKALQVSATDGGVDDQVAKKMPIHHSEVGESKTGRTLERVKQALQKRLVVVDLQEPTPGSARDGQNDGHDHDQDVHDQNDDHKDEALVAYIVRSSLKIALPRIEERNSDEQRVQTPLALSYSEVNRSDVLDDAIAPPTFAPNASNSPLITPYAVLPAVVQEELKIKLSNYLTWDKKLYANLNLDSESIRLVEIRPGSSAQIKLDLIKRPFEEVKNTYEALSYTWGPPSPKETIVVNGVQVQINEWLFGALSSLRLPNTKRRLWVDAICVNQANTAERSVEVQKMGDIYRLAKTVVIFHGWPSKTTREGSLITAFFKFLARSDHNGTSNTESAQTNINVDDMFRSCGFDKALVCKGFIDFCCRPWWRRVWTMQEFYLATEEPVWYWGSTGVSNTALKRDMPLLMTASWDLYGRKDVEPWIPRNIESVTGKPVSQFSAEILRISDLIARRNKTHGFDIPSRLYRSLSAQATDPRDLIYGLREIFDPVFRRVFVPDYFMRMELLYACLAVFLIQFEGWGDMLWWYPYRFQAKGLPSWLPDFTKRVVPAVTELLPRDHLAASTLELKLVVLNHTLHAEGYNLDTVEAFTPIIKGDETDVLQQLWNFDSRFNRNQSYVKYVLTREEQKNPSFNSFLTICRNLPSQDSGAAHPRLSVLGWTVKSNKEDDLPSTVVECLPCWDILIWHAFKIGSKSVSEKLGKSNSTTPGVLADIFSSGLNDAFRKMLGTDFIGDCVFDWHSLKHVLERLASDSPWSDPDSLYWQTLAKAPSSEQDEGGEDLTTRMSSFLASLKTTSPGSMGDIYRFQMLCSLVLLDSSSHVSFVRILDKLRSAGEQLHMFAFDRHIQAQVDDLESKDELVAARVRHNAIVKTHFSGRSLFWTRQGFHGLTTPGTELCEGADVLLLNGLTFPMVVKDFNQEEGSGRLIGCAIVRGVDLPYSKADTPKVPEGFMLGEKRLFKFK